ncbi:MAG: nicotinate-nucleotide adenylyltransferase [Solirubrobacterales bacterium]|nr:nicotinate-nucleotide adenylyltransferase [Solirubrobacterales bacterium]
MARIGIFGSTFNPPHLGHLILAQEARWRLLLDRVIAVPTGDPYHKEADRLPGRELRLAMAEAAFGDQRDVEVSDLELRREGPSFTCDTLEEIATANPDSSLRLLLGADAALGIGGWHRPDRVFRYARVAVAPRDLLERDRIEQAAAAAGGAGEVDFFPMPEVSISSTLIRERIRTSAPYAHLVPTSVASIIQNENLYVA